MGGCCSAKRELKDTGCGTGTLGTEGLDTGTVYNTTVLVNADGGAGGVPGKDTEIQTQVVEHHHHHHHHDTGVDASSGQNDGGQNGEAGYGNGSADDDAPSVDQAFVGDDFDVEMSGEDSAGEEEASDDSSSALGPVAYKIPQEYKPPPQSTKSAPAARYLSHTTASMTKSKRTSIQEKAVQRISQIKKKDSKPRIRPSRSSSQDFH